MLHRISAGVIVEDQGRVLLVNHVRPGRYDFWVCPGGGVKGDESLEQAAAREAFEETGLTVQVGQLLYIEELINPQCRFVKFWFSGACTGGSLHVEHPEARAEHIQRAGWIAPSDLQADTVFPSVLAGRYSQDRQDMQDRRDGPAEPQWPVRLPVRHMTFW